MKIALWYHSIVSGGSLPIDTVFACQIVAEQMRALDKSALLANTDEFHIGVNGDQDDANIVRLFVPTAKARFIVHGKGATTEIPTLVKLREWLPSHPDWLVLYHHTKGVTHPENPLYGAWRKRMEKGVVWGWRNCVAALKNGTDACGCHWLTPEQFPHLVNGPPFFGGTFWFATAKFLITLPPLPAPTWANRFEAENWIGRGPRRPKVIDYFPGWP